MTDLSEAVGAPTANPYYEVGGQFNGTKIDYNATTGDLKITLRITHQHETESVQRSITELGWFSSGTGGSWQSSGSAMFSRVMLPAPVSVPAGKYLQTTYDVEIDCPYGIETQMSNTNIIGADVPCVARYSSYIDMTQVNTGKFSENRNQILSGISPSGTASGIIDDWSGGNDILHEALNVLHYRSYNASNNTNKHFLLAKVAGKAFPVFGARIVHGDYYQSYATSVSSYTPGSYERSLIFEMGIGWPDNISSVPLGFMNVNGIGYRLFNDSNPGNVPVKLANQNMMIEHIVGWQRA